MPGMPTCSLPGRQGRGQEPFAREQKRAGEPGTAAGWGGSPRGLPQPDRRSPCGCRAGRGLPDRVRVEENLDKALLSPATAWATGAPEPRCEHAALPRQPERRVPREPRAAAVALTGLLSGLRQSQAYGAASRGKGGRAAPGASGERGLIRARGRPACLAHGGGQRGRAGGAAVGLGTGTATARSLGAGTRPGARAAPALRSCRRSRAPAPGVPGGQWERDGVKGRFKINKQKAFGRCFFEGLGVFCFFFVIFLKCRL